MNKSLNWYLRRHSLLYKIRFLLISKEATDDRLENFCYNGINPKNNIPEIYFEINQSIFPKASKIQTDFKKAIKIARWLENHVKGGVGLGKSSEITLRKMINGEGGVCSDLSQVYNNFCVINDIKVKEWGLKIISDDPTIKGGHSFNEIYSKEFQKWILIDVSKSICFYNSNPKLPLSVFEYLRLKKENHTITYTIFNKKMTPDQKRIQALYFTSCSFPFLITHYCNKTYDYFLNKLGFLPEPIVHGIVYLTGKSYVFEFPERKE